MDVSSLQRTIRRGTAIVAIQLSVVVLLLNDEFGGLANRRSGPTTFLAEDTLALWIFWGAIFYLVGSILIQIMDTIEVDGETKERERLAE